VLVLTVARGGPKLQMAADGSCLTRTPGTPRAPGQRQSDYCGFLGFGGNQLRGSGIRMEHVAGAFSMHLRRLVVDETGITGTFNVAWNSRRTTRQGAR
jgi:uncharacterized protein (TIGR03435 family)